MPASSLLTIFLMVTSGLFCGVAKAQGLTVEVEEAVRKYVRGEMRYEAARQAKASLYDLDINDVRVSAPCRIHERVARRAMIAYVPEDGVTSYALRPIKGGAAIELRYTLDAGDSKPADYNIRCKGLSPWQGWGSVAYRAVVGSDGNQSAQDIVKDLDAARLQTERQRSGVYTPSTGVLKFPKATDYKY